MAWRWLLTRRRGSPYQESEPRDTQRYALTRSPEDRAARATAGFRLDLVKPTDRRTSHAPVRRLTARRPLLLDL
jgi:hypothetical protein